MGRSGGSALRPFVEKTAQGRQRVHRRSHPLKELAEFCDGRSEGSQLLLARQSLLKTKRELVCDSERRDKGLCAV